MTVGSRFNSVSNCDLFLTMPSNKEGICIPDKSIDQVMRIRRSGFWIYSGDLKSNYSNSELFEDQISLLVWFLEGRALVLATDFLLFQGN